MLALLEEPGPPPPRLSVLCTAVVCNHALEVLLQAGEGLAYLPRETKAALLAVLRRRLTHEQLLDQADLAVATLVDAGAGGLLDLSGFACSDAALDALNEHACVCATALDVRRCAALTGQGLQALLHACPRLEVLRIGGCPASNAAAAAAVPCLYTRPVAELSGDSWEAGAVPQVACPELRYLVWPEADSRSVKRLRRFCPRIRVVGHATASTVARSPVAGGPCEATPRALPPTTSVNAAPLPVEADLRLALDAPILEPLLPLLDADVLQPRSEENVLLAAAAAAASEAVVVRPPRPHIAELFRMAYADRDERLSLKRAKNMRQNLRRAMRASAVPLEVALGRCWHGALRAAAHLARRDILPVDGW